MTQAAAKSQDQSTPSLAERFWSLAKGKPVEHLHPDDVDPAAVVKHVLAILDSLDEGQRGDALSVNTLSFLKLLRQHELGGDSSYASPEQIRGETMDERSLVFSVGVLLFERLTGRHPFGAEHNQTRRVARIRRGEFGSGVNYFPTVSAGLRTILMRAMGPFPEERYATLGEMRSHLEDYMSHNRVPPRLPGTTDAQAHSQATRVVDMSKVAQSERAVAHLRKTTLRKVDVAHFDQPTIESSGEAPARAMERAQTTVMQRRQTQHRPTPRSTTPVPTEAELFAPPPKPRSRMMPLVYAAGGAALASVLFFALGNRSTDNDNPSQPAKAPAEEVAPAAATTTAPATGSHVAQADTAAATAGATHAAAKTAPAPEPAPTPTVFDPQVGGENILALARDCFTEARLAKEVRFGLGVVYPSDDAKPRKLYFSGNKELTRDERACVTGKLTKLTPGALPDKPKLIDYWFKLSTSAKTIRVKTKP